MTDPLVRTFPVQFEGETEPTQRDVRSPSTRPGAEVQVLVGGEWVTAWVLSPMGRSAYTVFVTTRQRLPPFRY